MTGAVLEGYKCHFSNLDVRDHAYVVDELLNSLQVNNAGVHFYSENHDGAVETLETNYYGVKRVTKALLPLMRESWNGARIINVSSQAALLQVQHCCLTCSLEIFCRSNPVFQ